MCYETIGGHMFGGIFLLDRWTIDGKQKGLNDQFH